MTVNGFVGGRKKRKTWSNILKCSTVALCLYCLNVMCSNTVLSDNRLELWRNLSFLSFSDGKDLVRRGVSIEDRGNNGETPLIAASEFGMESTVQVLIDCGADVNARDDYGKTALTRAKQSGHLAIVRILSHYTTR
ncbi:MAG: ankyrin repeat domain-containing protein [Armatimonadetes bacterium]|nr:ankyrin repeat domain-containing protein [Armatimonadota bacterium]